MIKYIIHLADIHIRSGSETNSRYQEYLQVFYNLQESLKSKNYTKKNSIIVVAGDIFHNKNKIENFGLHLFKTFINILKKITTTIIIPGNHDFLQQYPDDPPLLDSIIPTLKNLYYLNETCTISIDNIGISTICVKDTLIPGEGHGIIKYLPEFPTDFEPSVTTKVALFHGSFGKTYYNHEQPVDTNNSYPLEMLKDFDIACLGDIHLYQSGKYKSCHYAYSGSLIQQSFGEDILDHGYIVWNTQTKEHQHIKVYNQYGFATFKYINDKTFIKYRNKFIPFQPTKDYPTILKTKTEKLTQNLSKHHQTTQESFTDIQYFKEYFNNSTISTLIDNPENLIIPPTNQQISTIIEKRNIKIQQAIDKYHKAISLDNKHFQPLFKLLTLNFSNCLCYGKDNYIDYTKFDNKTCIINAPNGYGKSALYEIICYAIYGEPMPSRQIKKYSASFINEHSKDAITTITFSIKDIIYTIYRYYTKQDTILKIKDVTLTFNDTKIKGIINVGKWIETNIGTIQNFLKTSMITQDFDFSFLQTDPKTIKKYIDQNINLNSIQSFCELIKESNNSFKEIYTYIDNTLNNLNIYHFDIDESTTLEEYNTLKKHKVTLDNKLQNLYIDYVKYPTILLESKINLNQPDITQEEYKLIVESDINHIKNKITNYENLITKHSKVSLENLKLNPPIKPEIIKTIPKDLYKQIKNLFNNINTIYNIVENYTSIYIHAKHDININDLDKTEIIKSKISFIENEIINNNELILNLQNKLNYFNTSLTPVIKPTISIIDAKKLIEQYETLTPKYPKKLKLFEKFTNNIKILQSTLSNIDKDIHQNQTTLNILQKQHNNLQIVYKPDITLEQCNTHIGRFDTLQQEKSQYDIAKQLNDYENKLSTLSDIKYNPNCEICCQQQSVKDKLKLIDDINQLKKQLIINIDIDSWIKEYTHLKNNLNYYKTSINNHEKYNNFVISQQHIQSEIDKILQEIDNLVNFKQSTQDDIAIIENKLKDKKQWIDDYLKLDYTHYKDVINQHKLYIDYQLKLNEVNTITNQINDTLKLNKQLNTDKTIYHNRLNNCYYTIMEAYRLFELYNIDRYLIYQEYIESSIDINKCYNIVNKSKFVNSYENYLYLSEALSFVNIHYQRLDIIKQIKDIEYHIDNCLIFLTNLRKQSEINQTNKTIYNDFITIRDDIENKFKTFNLILNKYEHFQTWLYDTHILPKIIKNTNNIIKESSIIPFTINAFIDNDSTQFTIGESNMAVAKASGFQKFLINIALRISFLELYRNNAICEQLFLDEGWTSADNNNRLLIPKVLHYLLSKFTSVILVSHIDEIKDNVDIKINISKKNNKSYIVV